jgi:hypothetical protein
LLDEQITNKPKAPLVSGAFSNYVRRCVSVFAPEPVGSVFVLAAIDFFFVIELARKILI